MGRMIQMQAQMEVVAVEVAVEAEAAAAADVAADAADVEVDKIANYEENNFALGLSFHQYDLAY